MANLTLGVEYTTSEGDMVDLICLNHYGTSSTTMEAVYAKNKGLVDYGPVLPAGVKIFLPELDTDSGAGQFFDFYGDNLDATI